MQDIYESSMSLEYANATNPVTTDVFIVWDELPWQNSYNDFKFVCGFIR